MPAFIEELGLESGLVAMTGPDSRLTWGEVDLLINRCANAFFGAGLGPIRWIAVFEVHSCETA